MTADPSPTPAAAKSQGAVERGVRFLRRCLANVPLWLAGGLVLLVFSWLPLSYYRMVGWAWILLWQVGAVALLVALWRQLRGSHRANPESGLSSLEVTSKFEFHGLGYGLDWVALALGIVVLLSAVVSPFPRVALWNVSLVVTYGAVLYVYRNVVDTPGARPCQRTWLTRLRLWWGLVVVAAGTAVVSLGLWRPDAAMWASENFLTALRNHQPLGHHNFVGGYFTLMAPLAAAAAIAAQGWMRRIWIATAGLLLLALYVSGSRGAILGLVVWLGVTWLSRLNRVKPIHRGRWVLAGLGGAIAVGLALASNPRIRTWFSAGGLADGPTLDRWFMLRLGSNILRDRPLLGVGPGVMSRVSNLYRPIEAGAGLDHIQQLHNTPVQLAGELGLLGLAVLLAGMVLVLRLWIRLWRQPLKTTDRALLGGIGGSLLTYGVSSLTDYQLENIPIAGALLGVVVLLLALGDRYLPQPMPIGADARQHGYLAVALWLGLLLTIWLPFTLTVAYGALADRAFYSQQLNLADTRWYKAYRLSPWDPTAAAVATEALWGLDQMLGDSEAQENVRSLMLDYAQQAQQAAPNDGWFNHNLAVLHQTTDPASALPYAARAVQLMPRHQHYGYWLLGDLLLQAGETRQAIAAFTLEVLVNPAALTYPHWQEAPYQAIYPAVARATLAEYDTLLAGVSAASPAFQALYETRVLLAWWTKQPMVEVAPNLLRPVVAALLRADSDPAAALEAVEHNLSLGQQSPELKLLATWLDPQAHPAPAQPQDVPSDLDALLIEESLAIRPLRLWLSSIVTRPDEGYRGSLTFAYRNYQAKQITLMLTPHNLQRYTLVAKLNLFPAWPREFPALDRRIEALRTKSLGLPHPTHNRFRLSDLDLSTS
ncbi:O-antigen ligase family protein [Nodosilinea sp. LEGE 07298]|uniref:O-antigen ligase family protein n=1 Tax=Nodosilinea sp. LEGE 07298 TaxID=2777970 RepID=UPI0018815F13|nr:O-antigen ligase family protein [Nodosilinea sp. LEGE 07298]MBE9109337.1 O-antigen ligase family protein [Nodosilinea sp. LEGE 07298]